jgi:hypothetical protein
VKRLVDMVQKLTLAPSQVSLGGKKKINSQKTSKPKYGKIKSLTQ